MRLTQHARRGPVETVTKWQDDHPGQNLDGTTDGFAMFIAAVVVIGGLALFIAALVHFIR